MILTRKLVLAAALASLCFAAQIGSLPSYVGPNISFDQFSGYIPVGNGSGAQMFYWYVESQGNPATDPLVVWYAGGPGCSGVHDMVTKVGPFGFDSNGDLTMNDVGWNKFSNFLVVESPIGVGFSYSTNPNDYNSNDEAAAENNLEFLQLFLKDFPDLMGRDLWLTGESYAGQYVPQLAQMILQTGGSLADSLKGIMVSNPVFSCPMPFNESIVLALPELWYTHGLVPRLQYMDWLAAGCPKSNPLSPQCSTMFDGMCDMMGDINMVSNFYDFCTGNNTIGLDLTFDYVNCTAVNQDDLAQIYLNRADVQAALHAQVVPPATSWNNCVGPPLLNYTFTWATSMPYYRAMFNADVKVLLYSGDIDIGVVPHVLTQTCVESLGRPLVQSWQPWTLRGQTAGYYEVFDTITYATVKGAGHMVVTFQPWAAYNLVSSFLVNGTVPSNEGSHLYRSPRTIY